MNEPWFNPGWFGLLGGFCGILGALDGIMAGMFIPKGKAKMLVLGVTTFACAVGIMQYGTDVVSPV